MNIHWENNSVDMSRWLQIGRGHVVEINGTDYCVRASVSEGLLARQSGEDGEPIKGAKLRFIPWTRIEDLRIY